MKIFLDMVGCRLNQAELEHMARQFRARGHEITSAADTADLVVVNTCAVTNDAASDSRRKVRQAARAGPGEIVVTGCWSSLEPQAAARLPNVLHVIHNDDKDNLVAQVLGQHTEAFDVEPIARQVLPGLRQRTRAFIKVQDGCDNHCTFCITTVARGDSRSRPVQQVLEDIHSSLAGGAQEIVLTGVHLGAWGQEIGLHLRDLVTSILRETDSPRLRLSSLEPWDLDEDFFSLWENPRLMPHLHLPLQSGSAGVLKRMLRKTTPDSFRQLIHAARAVLPQVAITTDVITGFPAESDDEFAETLELIEEIGFAGGHVFTYSARPGTPAARMKNHVPQEVRKRRTAVLRHVFDELGAAYRQQFIGRVLPVLWEASSERTEDGWRMEGLSGNYLRVTAFAPEPRWNRVDEVLLDSLTPDGLAGRIV